MDRSASSVLEQEETLWHELRDLVARFPDDEAVAEPGYFEEGWSAKDAYAHIGAWLAEAGMALQQIRAGTYTRAPEGAELDEMNRRFLEAMHDLSLRQVQAQAAAARTRMRHAWLELDGPSDDAVSWLEKSGPDHYREHLPRLREWLDDVRSRTSSS